MKFLIDTNIFKHTINDNIYAVACKCKEKDSPMYITTTILKELEPGPNVLDHERQISQEVYNMVNSYTCDPFNCIYLLDINKIDNAKEIYKSIRKRYYGWMENPDYLKLLISKGKITIEEIKSKAFKNKDAGECELLAIAKASNENFVIITNDLGRVYKHPDINIFDYFKNDGVVVYCGDDWINMIEFESENI